MRVCENCGTENREGELLCQECGELLADLSHMVDLATQTKQLGSPQRDPQAPQQLTIDAGRQGICRTPLWDSITVVVGRSQTTPARLPTLNLGTLGGEEGGVSRQHALIRVEGGAVLLIDLGSTNGTFLNGRRLVPNAPSVVEDGDQVIFGRLKTKVRFS